MNHPFDIGIIQKVFKAKHSEKIMVQVRVMMRPENVGMPWLDVVKQDINKLYWTESIVDIEADTIEGLCYILPAHKIQEDTAFEWTQKGLLRFYYSEMFNTKSRTLESLNGLLPQLLYSTLTYRSRVHLQFVIIDHR